MIVNLATLRAGFADQQPDLSSQFGPDDPRRLNHLSLEQQKQRAKELLHGLQSPLAAAQPTPKLSNAQHAIAAELGFKNWGQLEVHIEHSRIARDALRSGKPDSLDIGRRVLHIRCGTDIRQTLALAGFSGDFLGFYDPYVHGPVPDNVDLEAFIQIRAEFIAKHLDAELEQVKINLREQYAALNMARDYDEVYLWLEHDPYDQLILAKLLDYFSVAERRPPSLKLIAVTHYPGVKIFNGIGQLPPEALRVLWDDFKVVTDAQFEIGQQAWSALRSPTPQALIKVIATGTPKLPTMAIALARHLQQLPSERNGLNLTENLTLTILRDKGDMNAARLFGWYTNQYEALTFMGDTGYWDVLQELASAEHPAITLYKQGDRPNQWHVSLTDTGRRLLSDELDWITLNGINRWVGGIHLDSHTGYLWRTQDV